MGQTLVKEDFASKRGDKVEVVFEQAREQAGRSRILLARLLITRVVEDRGSEATTTMRKATFMRFPPASSEP
ncbi:MAG: hypothetical protein ACK5RC_12995 [Curvibacter sp.]|nr:hypothetical protein [Curvibacter sp.]